jgi:peptide/nickel transport system permease protein
MLPELLRRLGLSAALVFAVSVLTFIAAELTPGDPAVTILGTSATPQGIRALDAQLGLDQPIYLRYLNWLLGVLHGDLGTSIFTGEPVQTILNAALPITLTLIVGAVALSLLIGVPLGVIGATRRGFAGAVVDTAGMAGFGIPAFWLGLLLVIAFANDLQWFPPSGWEDISDSGIGWLQSAALPVITLAIGGVAVVAKQTRDGMSEVLSREFVRSLRARGLSRFSVLYKHALRAALPNVVTILGLFVVSLLLGTTLVESVFAIQGLGSVAVQATAKHDLPILQGATLYFTVIVVLVFAMADIVRLWLNPRLRTAR